MKKNIKKNIKTNIKTNRTEVVFILDKSGSMAGLEADTIGGFNSMLAKQQKVDGDATITTVLFDDRYELLHDRCDIRHIKPITEKEYYVEGSTALLDAIGRTIRKIVNVQKHGSDEAKADKVIFIIITDGCENASKEFSAKKVKSMIELEREKYGWEFIFLGANIDAIETANNYGINPDRAVNYMADAKGTAVSYASVSEAIHEMRTSKELSNKWKKKVDEDFKHRN